MMIIVGCNARDMWGHLLVPCCLPSLAWGVWQNQRGRVLSDRVWWSCVRGQNDQKREMQFALFEDLIWFWSSVLALGHSSILETSYATFRSHVAFLLLLEAFIKTTEAAYRLVLRQRSGWSKSFTKQVAVCEDLIWFWSSALALRHSSIPETSWATFALTFIKTILVSICPLAVAWGLCQNQRGRTSSDVWLLASEACLVFPGWGFFHPYSIFCLIHALFCLLLGNTIWQTSVQLLFAQN